MARLVREHNWSATPLGPIGAWPQSLKTAVDLLLAHGFPMAVLWGPESINLYNDAYRPILGVKHPATLGRPLHELWPEMRRVNEPLIRRVWAGETITLEDAHFYKARHGALEDAWYDLALSPLRGEAGHVAGVLVTVFETTERHSAEAALRENETRYRAFVTISSDVVYRMGPDWGEMRRLEGRGFVSDTAEPTEDWMERYIHPDDRTVVQAAIEEAVRTKGVFELEHRVVRVDGTLGWTLSRAVPILDERGEVVEWLGTASDVTARREAEETLREGEERRVFLLKLNDALRPLTDPVELQAVAARVLGEHLGTNQVHFGETIGDYVHIGRGYGNGLPPMVGRLRASDFGERLIAGYRQGRTQVSRDTDNDPTIAEAERQVIATAGLRAYVAVPLVKEGEWVATLVAHSAEPRDWTADEIKIVEETAERTWEAIERARAEEALRASEEQYRTLFTSIDEGFCTIEVLFDERGEAVDYRFLEANPAFERQTGLENAVGKTVRELAPEHEGFWFEIYGRIARTGEAMRFEHEAAALGRFYDVYAFRIGEPGENRVAIIFNDILMRKRAEEERARRRERELAALVEAAERERISRELHDRVAHHMGVAHQSLELFAALADSNPGRAAERLRLARESTRLALDQTRAISAELKRLQEEELENGLEAAFRALAETSVPEDMRLDVSVSGEESEIPSAIALQVYLAMREAVRNAVRHSGCSRIGVALAVSDGEFVGRVEDDGEGFDPEAVGEATPSWGVGLRSMRERTELLGGSASVDSRPGTGTTVEVRVPLDGTPRDDAR
jgi:PAS domain S-box-containing protein